MSNVSAIWTAVVSNGTFGFIEIVVNLNVLWAMSYSEKSKYQAAQLLLVHEDKPNLEGITF